MKIIEIWKRWYSTRKAMTLIATISLFILIVGMVIGVSLAIFCKTNQNSEPAEVISEEASEMENNEVVLETEISVEEYYEEELAMDESTENVEYQEPKEQAQVPEIDKFPYYIKVNRLMNTVTVYAKDEAGAYTVPVKAMVCSCGLNDGTPLGTYKTSTKYEWRALYGNVYGQYAYRINGPIMFHSVPYYTMDKGNLESEEYNKLGEFASLGCVRLMVRDAQWLVANCPSGTTVEIYDNPDPGPLGKPSAPKIDLNSPCRGWDPTDSDPANPWRTTGPTINYLANVIIERGSTIDVMAGVTAFAVTGDAVGVSVTGGVNVDVPGIYYVDYSATDELGNTSTGRAEYKVVDTTRPTITSNGDLTLQDGAFDLSQLEAMIKNQASASDGNYATEIVVDNIDYEMLSQAIQSKVYGTYQVKMRAKDDSGNESDNIVINVVYYGSEAASDTEQVMPDTEITESNTEQVVPGTEITESNTEQILSGTEIVE